MQIINTTIHERLKFTRIYFRYSQTELAKMLDVKQSVYANWELNKRLIPLRHLISLANIYQINVDYLLALTDIQIHQKPINVDKVIISRNLRILLYELKINVKTFAKNLNVSCSPIYNYLNCKNLIPTYVLYDIARNYNISTDWILGRTSQKNILK